MIDALLHHSLNTTTQQAIIRTAQEDSTKKKTIPGKMLTLDESVDIFHKSFGRFYSIGKDTINGAVYEVFRQTKADYSEQGTRHAQIVNEVLQLNPLSDQDNIKTYVAFNVAQNADYQLDKSRIQISTHQDLSGKNVVKDITYDTRGLSSKEKKTLRNKRIISGKSLTENYNGKKENLFDKEHIWIRTAAQRNAANGIPNNAKSTGDYVYIPESYFQKKNPPTYIPPNKSADIKPDSTKNTPPTTPNTPTVSVQPTTPAQDTTSNKQQPTTPTTNNQTAQDTLRRAIWGISGASTHSTTYNTNVPTFGIVYTPNWSFMVEMGLKNNVDNINAPGPYGLSTQTTDLIQAHVSALFPLGSGFYIGPSLRGDLTKLDRTQIVKSMNGNEQVSNSKEKYTLKGIPGLRIAKEFYLGRSSIGLYMTVSPENKKISTNLGGYLKF